MNNEYIKETASAAFKIKQLLGEQRLHKEFTFDKKKLFQDALAHLSELLEISLEIPAINEEDFDRILEHISIYSNIRIQKIILEDNWWNYDLGIILSFIDDTPIVLIPKSYGGYQRSTPSGKIFLSKKQLLQISNYAYTFTPPLPEKINSLFALFKFTLSKLWPKLRSILYLQFFLSFILMSLPLLMSYFFNHFNEFINNHNVFIIEASLIINCLMYCLLSVFQSIVLLNFRFKAQTRLEPAIWDRLLKLVPAFFRQFNAGNIAYRARIVVTVQEIISQSTILSIFGLITSFISFVLMCYYNFNLAMLGLLSFIIIAPILLVINHRYLLYQRKTYEYLTKQSGFVFQIINNILKFKVSANEHRAFNLWSEYFAKLLAARYKAEKTQASFHIIQGSLLMLMTIIFFCIYIYFNNNLSLGNFIAFNAAFSQYFISLLLVSTSISMISTIIPLFEQSLVIYQAKMEPIQCKGSQIVLSGKISIKNLSFRYNDNQPLIYKNLNLDVYPGEIIGITGSSGCGKSTLFRILLGLETSLEGQILYDDLNINILNLSSLRQQVGVVTQRSLLTPGTIFENIVGNNKNLTRKDAWDMVYELGMEQMITALPMEMETVITAGLQTLSRGEQQRIILARALIKKPKILFLDEATSALDARNQEKIKKYLSRIKITQLIIAHRLTTLKNADRIFVIAEGGVMQEGNFYQLANTPGLFQELAKLQFFELK